MRNLRFRIPLFENERSDVRRSNTAPKFAITSSFNRRICGAVGSLSMAVTSSVVCGHWISMVVAGLLVANWLPTQLAHMRLLPCGFDVVDGENTLQHDSYRGDVARI